MEAVVRADAAAAALDRAVAGAWQDLLAVLRDRRGWQESYRRVLDILRYLPDQLQGTLADRLRGLAEWGHRATVQLTVDAMPEAYLRSVAGPVEGLPNKRLSSGPVAVHGLANHRIQPDRGLGNRAGLPAGLAENSRPRLVQRQLTEAVSLSFTDAGQLRARAYPEPTSRPLSDSQKRRRFAAAIMPPPSAEQVNRLVYGSTTGAHWTERLSSLSRLAPPEALAQQVATGMMLGKTQQQIARDLQPMLQNVRTSARRIARTEGMRVAHGAQLAAWEGMGDLIEAYQVHATLDQHTRSWHAHRSGTIYYKDPKPGQKGLAQCPHPPDEAADPSQRPAGTPATAPNCRCWLSPVLKAPEHVTADPEKMAVFQNQAGSVIPDPSVYADWFAGADERRRRIAVGPRRYDVVRQLLGRLVDAGTLRDGRRVTFQPRPEQRRDQVMVYVDPRRLDADWQKDEGYLPPTGEGTSEIRGRRERFGEFLQKGQAVQASKVYFHDGKIAFEDGRHRFAVLRDQGVDRMAVQIDRKQLDTFRQRYGATEPSERGKPAWQDFLEPDTGRLVPLGRLKAESDQARAERAAKVQALIAERRELTKTVATFGFEPPPA